MTFGQTRLAVFAACAKAHLRFFVLVALCVFSGPALAQERAELRVEAHDNYGRMILEFPQRFDLPAYNLKAENGVLAIEFEGEVDISLPDIAGALPQFITVARIDPDLRGIRMGLNGELRISTLEAGELLFIDVLPLDWQGVTPGLPHEVVAELTRRTKEAAIEAERRRKLAIAYDERPRVDLRVGYHPTFVRLKFDWSYDAEGRFTFEDGTGTLAFNWPIDVDLYPLKTDMPAEVVGATNLVTLDQSRVVLEMAEGVEPRFYEISPREYIIDIDLLNPEEGPVDVSSLLPEAAANTDAGAGGGDPESVGPGEQEAAVTQTELTPRVEKIGSTIRIGFPFEQDTPAAVFERGDVLWMLFDTPVQINKPDDTDTLEEVATDFSALSAGGATIVRMNMNAERLASFGSEGRSWVLSLGDVVLQATEPVELVREPDANGHISMVADIERAANVHEVRDPEVGDVLEVVTAYPPARGMIKTQNYVDFTALQSVHGLAIRPKHDGVRVDVTESLARIDAERGLIVSPPQGTHAEDAMKTAMLRDGYMDLVSLVEKNPQRYRNRQEEILRRVADSELGLRDANRLELGRFLLANEMSYESVGVLDIALRDVGEPTMAHDMELTRAAAQVMAGRSGDALPVLNEPSMSDLVDALLWRAIGRAAAEQFDGARTDALGAEPIVTAYPYWVRYAFWMAGAEAAIETGDIEMGSRFLSQVETASLSAVQLSRYTLLSGRLEEVSGDIDEALGIYGRVISDDIRPTRAEAVYRTLKVLDDMDRLDATRGAEVLAAEATVWRGGSLEAKMLRLLADLFFRSNNFREAFEMVHQAAVAHPDASSTGEMLDDARRIFADLYLNGQADAMAPIEALTLYYDFQQFTPAGARGDEMIRNLARRLIRVDLLAQAAELLEYQVDERLDGAARAQIAADLAVIRIADRAPQQALEALHTSRVTGLPPSLERQRRILEARALVDAGREDLALELLSSMDGRDADLLRVDAHWRAKRYQDAAELLERVYAQHAPDGPLSASSRANLVKAAVGFVLSGDKIGLSRLRNRFADDLAQTPEWPLFDFVTGPVQATSLEFRQVARDVADEDSLNAFLSSYRDLYGTNGALAPVQASQLDPQA